MLASTCYTANIDNKYEIVTRCFWIFLIGFCMSEFLDRKEDYFNYAYGFLFAGVISIVYTFVAEHANIGGGRLGGFLFGAATGFASVCMNVAVISTIFYFFLKKKFLLLITIFCFIGVLLSGSRKPLLFMLAFLPFSYYVYSKNFLKKIRLILIAITLISACFYAVMHFAPLYDSIGKRVETMLLVYRDGKDLSEDSSMEQRYIMKVDALRLWMEAPILGHGTDSFKYLSPTSRRTYSSHCGFTEILCNFGIVGFFIFFGFWLKTIYKNLCVLIKTKCKNKFLMLNTFVLISLLIIEYQGVTFMSAYRVGLLIFLFKAGDGTIFYERNNLINHQGL